MNYFIVFLVLTGGHFAYSGYLYDKGLGTECLYDEDCITRNSFCKGNKICSCKIGYQYDPGSDVCFPKEIDLKCSEDYDCSALQNAKCVYGKCQCKVDYVPSKDKGACLPSMRLTSICEEDSQCHSVMNKSYCDPVMRRCVCERGLQQDPYRLLCIQQARLHNPCLSDKDCEVSEDMVKKVTCKIAQTNFLKTCECADGYKEENDTCIKDGSSHAVLGLSTIIASVLIKWLI